MRKKARKMSGNMIRGSWYSTIEVELAAGRQRQTDVRIIPVDFTRHKMFVSAWHVSEMHVC